jgi:hypothetical protein
MTDLDLRGAPDLSSPEETDAAIAKLTKGVAPEPPDAHPAVVTLMKGLETGTECLAEVRELNGYDEEAIARFQAMNPDAGNVPAVLNRVAELATVAIDGHKPTLNDIESLLVGDRNILIMAIRRLTYGPEVAGSVQCPSCLEQNEVSVDPWTDLEFVPYKGEFFTEIELRHGSRVTMRMMLAGDQSTAFTREMTMAERNSILLERLVMDIDRQQIHAMASTAAQATRSLGLADRRTILEAMVDQPGYQFGREVDGRCASCENELGLRLEVADLLQG